MSKEILVSSTSLETKLAILEDNRVAELFIERAARKRILGNIYKGKVTRVLPGMQAAFVDIGLERDTFLYVSDFFEDDQGFQGLLNEDAEELIDANGNGSAMVEEESVPQPANRSARRRHPSVGHILPRRLPVEGETGIPLNGPMGLSETEPGGRKPGRGVLPDYFGSPLQSADPVEEEFYALPREVLEPELTVEQPPLVEEQPPPRGRSAGRGRKRSLHQRGSPSIGDLVKEGQEILVQVAKEPIGKKGARITSHCVLPGRYVVFMPTVRHIGISRRIVSDQERQRLRDIVIKLRGDANFGFIVRTVGENHSEEDLRGDMRYLTGIWENVRRKAESCAVPSLVYEEPNLAHRIVRDYFSKDFKSIRVDEVHEYEQIRDLVRQFNPELVNRVHRFNRRVPMFDHYGVNSEIEKALRSKVWLKKGGHIVINQTEALVSVDVNTGKFVGKTNSLEDTITETNLDAVKEVVRQLRLRDLGGIIVIDFIDMEERKNRQKVLNALQEELAKDKAPSRVLQFNEFGLVAITRKRAKQSLERLLCQPCSSCQGTGMVKSSRTIGHSIYDEVGKRLTQIKKGRELVIRCHPEVGDALRNRERGVLRAIQELTGNIVSVNADPLMSVEEFELVEG